MVNKELGLPLEYSELHQYFDALGSENIILNQLIENILKKHNVSSVLDLTCGTGSQVFWLVKKGFEVTGVDLSPKLLAIAQDKAAKEKLKVDLHQGDMRTSILGQFDAVITIANAIGHLTKDDYEIALKNIHANLKPGGLYIFDIFNVSAMTDEAEKNLALDVSAIVNNTHIHHIQYSKIDYQTSRMISYDTFTIQEGDNTQTIKNTFTLQIYSANELIDMLSRNGFEVANICGLDGSDFIADKTTQMLFTARKL